MDVCFHCGDECTSNTIKHQDHYFCCYGCKTVFDILNENDLSYYYELETSPGSIPSKYDGKFDYLKNETIAQKLLEFDELSTKIVSFVIPSIHCNYPVNDGCNLSGEFFKRESKTKHLKSHSSICRRNWFVIYSARNGTGD